MTESSKEFANSLRARIGMPQPQAPQEKLQEVWTALQEQLSAIQPAVDQIKDATDEIGDPEIEKAIGDGVVGLTQALETAVDGIEAVEDILVELGLVEDDELLEPEAQQARDA
jgi:hypothetical protein